MIPESTNSIEQRAFLKGYQKLSIQADGDLEIIFKRGTTHREMRVPLWHLNPKSERLKFTQSGSLVGAIIFGLCTLGNVAGMIGAGKDASLRYVLIFPLCLFAGLFAVCFWKYRTESINSVVFYFRDGNGQLHVWFDNPDPATFTSFCDNLTRKADLAWQNRPIDPSVQSLAGEIAALKKLKDTGVLNDVEFERAKAKILEQSEQRRIGFN